MRRIEHVLCHAHKVLGRGSHDALADLTDVAMLPCEGKCLAKSERITLKVVARYENLADKLLLRHIQRPLAQRMTAQVLQLVHHEAAALLNLAVLAAEVHAPDTGVDIIKRIALHVVNSWI